MSRHVIFGCMSFSNNPDEEDPEPPLNYYEFQQKLEELESPIYSLVGDGLFGREEFDRLRNARSEKEYLRTWESIQETRREEREEEYRQKRREDSQVQWQRR